MRKLFRIIMIIGAMNFISIAPPITSIDTAVVRLVYVGLAVIMVTMAEE